MALGSLVSDTRSLKRQQWENQDIGNKLPEEIIQHIVSFLPTKDAVRTSVLSKRWEYLWVFHPNVKLYADSVAGRNFVDRALLLCDSTVKKFSLETRRNFDELGRLTNWITAMVRRNVEELHIEIFFAHFGSFNFPYSLFSCASLTRLRLSMKSFLTCPPSVHLLSLKHLVLERIIFDDANSVENLFTGCPMLETTSLLQCMFKCTIYVSAPKLHKLEIHEDYSWQQYFSFNKKVMIFGPCLKSFHLKGGFLHSYRLNDLPSLDEAIISVENEGTCGRKIFLRRLDKVLKRISHVRNLSFSCGAVKAIELDGCAGLMKILQNCPCLETLRFEGGIMFPANRKEEKRILTPVPPCFMSCLKKIEILFDNDYENQKLFRNAAKVLLKRAFVLEKLIVYLPNQYAQNYSPARPMNKGKLIKGLIELPRASKVCQIEFIDSEMKSL